MKQGSRNGNRRRRKDILRTASPSLEQKQMRLEERRLLAKIDDYLERRVGLRYVGEAQDGFDDLWEEIEVETALAWGRNEKVRVKTDGGKNG